MQFRRFFFDLTRRYRGTLTSPAATRHPDLTRRYRGTLSHWEMEMGSLALTRYTP